MRPDRLAVLTVVAMAVTLFVGCGGGGAPAEVSGVVGVRGQVGSGAAADPVRIGSKNFTEQLILAHMYAALLESNRIPVRRELNLGETTVVHGALVGGRIDLYPEYTGTGLLVILKEPAPSDPNAVYATVSREYRRRFNLVWLDQATMNDSQALVITRTLAEERGLATISELSVIAPELTIASPSDFSDREDGLLGLQRVYGGFQFKEVKAVEPAAKYRTLLRGQADVLLAFGTDGQIDGYSLVVLRDDMGLWPPYHVAPVVRQETLESYPGIPKLLNRLAPLLTDEAMRGLNWLVDGPEKRDPETVAREFLRREGLVNS